MLVRSTTIEPIQNVAEMAVNIEAHDLAAKLQIVFQEHRDLFVVTLDLGNQLRKFLDILDLIADRRRVRGMKSRRFEGSLGFEKTGNLLCQVVLLKVM